MLTIHLRVNDEATARPTPVRLSVTGPDGTFHAPFGRAAEFSVGRNEAVGGHLQLGRDKFVYIDGSCEIKLPAGVPLRVRAVKGPEYEPLDREVTLGAGQMALRFAIRRWSNLAAEGWHAGDSRAHFVSPHAALLEAAAEEVAVVNLLACAQPFPSLDGTAYPTLPNMLAFSGQSPALEADGRMVVVNTLNSHPVLGRVGLLNCHRAVFPLTFGGEDTDDWSVTDWCHQCHRKGGLAVWVDAFRDAGGTGGEALVVAVLGAIDAIEFDARPPLVWWYRLLNAGVRLPPVGGSGKDSNRIPIGAMRTYAKLDPGEPLTYKSWIEAVRAGRTFTTNGPILKFDASGGASVESLTPFERLEVVADGRVIATTAAALAGSRWTATLRFTRPTDCGWLAARCVGGSAFAHTAPVPVGRAMPREADAAPLRRCVEQTRQWIEQHGRFAEEKRKQKLIDLCDEALARLDGSRGPVTP